MRVEDIQLLTSVRTEANRNDPNSAVTVPIHSPTTCILSHAHHLHATPLLQFTAYLFTYGATIPHRVAVEFVSARMMPAYSGAMSARRRGEGTTAATSKRVLRHMSLTELHRRTLNPRRQVQRRC
jgi:hypothetical protein